MVCAASRRTEKIGRERHLLSIEQQSISPT
jgi:hypothetical protein